MELSAIRLTTGVRATSDCSECKGECCKRAAGLCTPTELAPEGANLASVILTLLYTGNWAIDCWEGDISGGDRMQIWYLRPAHTNAEGSYLDRSWGGRCVFLTDEGCKLKFEQRPHECRHLEPAPKKERDKEGCRLDEEHRKPAIVREWLKYQDIMDRVIRSL